MKKKDCESSCLECVLYGLEKTWTVNSDMIQRIEAFEMWVWRRMEKVSWTERKTNEEVLTMMGERRQLIRIIKTKKMDWTSSMRKWFTKR